MTTALDDDDLDYDDEPYGAHNLQPRPSLVPAGAGDVEKVNEAEWRAQQRLVAAQMWRRKCDAVLCAGVVISIASLLTFTTYKILVSPDPDLALTYVVHSTRHPHFVSTPNDSKVDANKTAALLPPSLEELEGDSVSEGGLLEPMSAPDESTYYFCGTEACKNMAGYLEGLVGAQRNGCASLYDHVCTRWSRGRLQLAESRSHYDVDDTVLDDMLDEVGRMLLQPEAPLLHQAAFYSDCVAGLLMGEQDLENIVGDLVSLSEEFTPSLLAEVIVRMSRLGVSPFFDVFVDVVNGTFSARLVTSRTLPVMRFLRNHGGSSHFGAPGTARECQSVTTKNHTCPNVTEFFRSLEREMCAAITEMANLSRPCTAAVDSSLSSGRDYMWYASNAPAYLTAAIASMLEDLSAYRKELEEKIGAFGSFRIALASKRERMITCLRFIDQHDPELVPHLVAAHLSPLLGADISYFLGQFKAHLDKKIPSASTITVTVPTALLTDNDTIPYLHSEDFYGRDPASNVSRLRRFLERSAWKRWTCGFSSRTSSLSSAARFLHRSSTVEVPLGLFNVTMMRDKWLRDVSLARVGPRVLKTLFLGALSREVKATNFFACVSRTASASSRVSGRRFIEGAHVVSLSLQGPRSEHDELQLDIEEMAAFYMSLLAYRERVGDAVAIPGSLLNSDSLFLLYYVYNNCVTGSNGKDGDYLNGGVTYDVHNAPSLNSRRHRVDSVAAMFGGLLLEECQATLDLSACEGESDGKF